VLECIIGVGRERIHCSIKARRLCCGNVRYKQTQAQGSPPFVLS
jgi:hypothetical protein